jgi:hypothetical protein
MNPFGKPCKANPASYYRTNGKTRRRHWFYPDGKGYYTVSEGVFTPIYYYVNYREITGIKRIQD